MILPIQTRAIKGQLRAITDYAIRYDSERLAIRGGIERRAGEN